MRSFLGVREHALAMGVFVAVAGCAAFLGGCTATPSVYQTMMSMGSPTRTYAIAQQDGSMNLPSDAARRFEELFAKKLAAKGGPKPAAPGVKPDLTIEYTSLAYDNGSAATRVVTGAASVVAPVDQVTDAGGGDVALLLQFRSPEGKPIGQIVVNSRVRGLFGSASGSLEEITEAAAKYTASRFSSPDATHAT